ncbi:MAG: SUMF1/EgtB/PvdO family nonheme iron enzyme [Antarcticimicrobium sp.]|uniref:SUMF1/EgtB/PvdO family nonheme iron enzyme n=1 Tax=Antarcticimicrobium sp. TaxID=2824147 RepID=UPI0026399B6A|nr:SUMF1/EgtB/PvdO family nonheme iron enzyme [Antarcticimicrobium sp.]MDF1717770.1 SUMF1/EgtB/PvdO family nonheme iron enzyme [Antarcticimicrobium sp.]
MRGGRAIVLAGMAALALYATASQAEDASDPTPWPRELYDPAEAPADLVLPMPCGAAMAFQKVAVPLAAADPLADRRVRLGQSGEATGYAEYLRTVFLRGAFTGEDAVETYYYIARYELTQGQARALAGDCADPGRRARLAQGGLDWFRAVALARDYTGWLIANAPETLPRSGDAPAFLRLPTEAEWEYAARGGAKVDASLFGAPVFFDEGTMGDYALHQGAGSAAGRLGPVGLRAPNPLGLFDVYGNAEELVIEPFRLNAVGRVHGQAGGVVTRGGSVFSTADQIYSAQRTEYPPFDAATGAPLSGTGFGMRLVLSAPVVTSDARLAEIRDRWIAQATAQQDAETEADPAARLAGLIEAEPDPSRARALSELQLEFRRSRDRVQTALAQSARATLLAGAVFVETILENADAIQAKQGSIRMLISQPGRKSEMFNRQVQGHLSQLEDMRRLQETYLLSLSAALETLMADIPAEARGRAYAVLSEELSLSGQTRTAAMLARFWDDLAVYAQRPDMDSATLLEVALN